MSKEKILGVTTITAGFRISILKNVREILEKSSEKLKVGNRLVYYQDEKGEVILRKA